MATRRGALIAILILPAAGCGPVRLTVDDAIISPRDNKLHCVAYLQREPIFGIRHFSPGSGIEFKLGDQVVASARTSATGCAETYASYPQGGATRLDAVADVLGTKYRGSASVFEWDDHRTIIVVDIDRTIARTDFDHLVLRDGADERSTPLAGSRRTMEMLARDCRFIYVTARPRFLLEKTRMWLEDEEFPPGPVIASPGLREAIQRTEYKLEVLAQLRKLWPTLLIGIGNSESDAEAYEKSGLLTLLVNQKRTETILPKTYGFRNWKALARFYEANRELLSDPAKLSEAVKHGRIESLIRPAASEVTTQSSDARR